VARLGGFGIVAHPDSPKRALSWHDWDLPVDAFEWLNADSEWRDESLATLVAHVPYYLLRGPETIASLFDRPRVTLDRWDRAGAAGRRLVALAAADAHARVGWRGSPDETPDETSAAYLPVPSYDARRVIDAIRRGRVFTVIDARATPGALDLHGETPSGRIVRMGDVVGPADLPLRIRAAAAAPPGAEIRLLRSGEVVGATTGVALAYDVAAASAGEGSRMFRVEVHVPGLRVPWITSNAIYVVETGPADRPDPPAGGRAAPHISPDTAGRAAAPAAERRLFDGDAAGWAIEHDADSAAAVDALPGAAGPRLAFRFGLAEQKAGAYAALVRALDGPIGAGAAVRFRARASRPVRLSVQVRLGSAEADLRWRRSIRLDADAREAIVPLAEMEGVSGDVPAPRRDEANGLLFVIDRTHTRGGTTGIVWFESIAIVAAPPPVRSAP
jgi:hypothetical protein